MNLYRNDMINTLKKGAVKYKGITHRINAFVQKEQLLDKSLWDIFVEQFKTLPDSKDSGWRGEFWGKMMRGACLTYTYTHSAKLYSVLRKSILDLLETQREDGSFRTYHVDCEFRGWDLWSRKYVMLGCLYFLDICKSEQLKQRILKAVYKHADYICEKITSANLNVAECSKANFGGMNSCSILEPFVKLYKLSGEKRYIDFAKHIISSGFTADENIIELALTKAKYPYEFKETKAYEMMSCFQGLLEYYTVTGDERYFTASINLFDMIAETELTEVGALGCRYEFFNNSKLYQTEEATTPILETCVTVTWMNCCYQLLRLTGDSKYADYIEKSALNAMYGAVNIEKNVRITKWLNPGRTYLDAKGIFYPFDSYSPLVNERRGIDVGGKRDVRDDGAFYGCCYCIGTTGTAISALYGVMETGDGYVINTYEPARMQLLSPSGKTFVIRSLGDLLNGNGKITFEFEMSAEEWLNIKLRIPAWSKNTRVIVCGVEKQNVHSGNYLDISGCYADGNKVEVLLDNAVKTVVLNGKTALKKGPFALARDERYGDWSERGAIQTDEDGNVILKNIKTGLFHCRGEFEIQTVNGKTFKMCDYASAGNQWDEEQNAKICVWL